MSSRLQTELLAKTLISLLAELKVAKLNEVFIAIDILDQESVLKLDESITRIRNFLETV